MPHEAAALTLYDESLKQLRVAAFDFPEHESTCATGKIIPFEGNPIGEAFTTRKTDLDRLRTFAGQSFEDGFRLCFATDLSRSSARRAWHQEHASTRFLAGRR